MNKTELNPCPFCGGAAVNDGKEIWCSECFVNTACGISYDEAVKNWNSRAPVSKGDEIYINSDRYKVFTVTHHTTGGISEIDCDAMAPR